MKPELIKITEKNNNLVFNKPGVYVVYFNNISGTISCRIEAENIKLYMVGLYDTKGKDKYTVRTEQIHLSPNSFSDLFVLSVADESSSLSFSGLIRIEKDAQQSHAYQKNQNLLLSGDAFVDSRPILEILANDVFCTHGSTTGPISKDQLYYLQTKGLSLQQAKELSITGFKNQVVDKLADLGVQNI